MMNLSLGALDAGDFGFLNGHDARLEVVLGLGLVFGDLPVSLDVSAGFVVFASAVGENEESVGFNAAEHVLDGGVCISEVDEEELERLAGVVVGLVQHFNFVNDFVVLQSGFKRAHDLFAVTGLVSITDTKNDGLSGSLVSRVVSRVCGNNGSHYERVFEVDLRRKTLKLLECYA